MGLLDMEGRSNGQSSEFREAFERQQQEVGSLRESLRRKEEEMRSANMELLQQRDDEYQAKVSLEKQREKDRSIALLENNGGAMPGMSPTSHASRGMSPKPSSRTSTGSTRRGASLGAHQGSCGGEMLPPLPLSAR